MIQDILYVVLCHDRDADYKIYRCSIESPSEKDEGTSQVKRPSRITPTCIADLHGPKRDAGSTMVEAWWTPSTGCVDICTHHSRGFEYGPARSFISTWPPAIPINNAISPEHVCKDTLHASHSINGRVWRYSDSSPAPFLWAVSDSGRYTAMILECNESGSPDPPVTLRLLEFVQSPSEVRCKNLEVPCFIDLEEVYSIGIDEHYGVIYLSDCRGVIFALPYA